MVLVLVAAVLAVPRGVELSAVAALQEGPQTAPGVVLVKFREGPPSDEARQQLERLGARIERVLPGIEVRRLRVPEGAEERVVEALRRRPDVEYAEPDHILTVLFEPNDPCFSQPSNPCGAVQWGPQKVNAPQAWDRTVGAPSVLIAMVDTGVWMDHPDLNGRVLGCQGGVLCDFVNDDGDPSDDHGHGTHVAGIAAAAINNGVGIAGMAGGVRVLAVKVLGATGNGTASAVAEGIVYAADQGARAINLSLGCASCSESDLNTLKSAKDYAQGKGALLIAAAGNDRKPGCPVTVFPAAFPGVVAVSATQQNDAIASFSTCGWWVDVAAPGVSIVSTVPSGSCALCSSAGYRSASGTSMATPHVTGLAALVWSLRPGYSATQVQDLIKATAVDLGPAGQDPDYGYGRIDAAAALRALPELPFRSYLPFVPHGVP